MPKLVLATLIAAALLCAACAPAPSDSGIRGLVTIGPVSPVQQQGEPGATPYSARIVVRRSGGGTAAEVKSGADGRFSVNLAPGSYVLEPQSPAVMPFAKPQEVTVDPHRFTEVTVQYDSGIR
jgi:hypothetical protein